MKKVLVVLTLLFFCMTGVISCGSETTVGGKKEFNLEDELIRLHGYDIFNSEDKSFGIGVSADELELQYNSYNTAETQSFVFFFGKDDVIIVSKYKGMKVADSVYESDIYSAVLNDGDLLEKNHSYIVVGFDEYSGEMNLMDSDEFYGVPLEDSIITVFAE